jgi:uncharacterized phosphatase
MAVERRDERSDFMTTVCLIRHGETDWNRQGRHQGRADIDLNSRGKEQANRVALYLRDTGKWDIIVTSPLRRAKSTAQRIAQIADVPSLIEMDAFVEQDCGEADGLTLQEAEMRFGRGILPGAESRDEVRVRSQSGMEQLRRSYQGCSILVVTHGHVIRTILREYADDPQTIEDTDFANTSLNFIKYDGVNWRAGDINRAVHLN